MNAMLAGRTGRPADSFGALGSLMYGPVVRGPEGGLMSQELDDHRGRGQARHLHHLLGAGHRAAGGDHGQHRLRWRQGVQGDLLHRLDAAEGRRRPDRRGQRRRGPRGREPRPHPGDGDVPDQGRDRADDRVHAPRSASSTWSATATSRSSRVRARMPRRSRPTTPSRSTSTSPALDLTVLFNGFQPLFQALNPQQVNDLSLNLVQVLQGEGGTVAGLVQKTASLTNSLADRDQLIGEVITNLSQTLETVDQRHQQLSELIVELKGWMTDLARDREHDRRLAVQHLRPHDGRRRPGQPQPPAREGGRRQAAPARAPAQPARRTARPSSTCSTGCPSR